MDERGGRLAEGERKRKEEETEGRRNGSWKAAGVFLDSVWRMKVIKHVFIGVLFVADHMVIRLSN